MGDRVSRVEGAVVAHRVLLEGRAARVPARHIKAAPPVEPGRAEIDHCGALRWLRSLHAHEAIEPRLPVERRRPHIEIEVHVFVRDAARGVCRVAECLDSHAARQKEG